VLSWDAQLEDAKKEIAELEDRISALREELRGAQWATDAARSFMWADDSPFVRLGGFRGMDTEARQIIWDIIVTRPLAVMAIVCRNFASQLVRFDIRQGGMELASKNPGVLPLLEKQGISGLDSYRTALQHDPQFPPTLLVAIHRYSMIGSVIILASLLVFGARILAEHQIAALGVIIAGVLFNALIVAAGPGPFDRFNSRVIWLIPAIAIILSVTTARRLMQVPTIADTCAD
jgi:hypothetical protein